MITSFFDKNTVLIFDPPLKGEDDAKIIDLLFKGDESNEYWYEYDTIREKVVYTNGVHYVRIYDNEYITTFSVISGNLDNEALQNRIDWFKENNYRILDGYSVIPDVNQAFDKLYESEDDFDWAKDAVNEYEGLKGKPWHIDFDTDEDFIEIQKWLFKQGFRWGEKGIEIEKTKGIRSIQSIWPENIKNQTLTRSDSWRYQDSLEVTLRYNLDRPIHIKWSDFINRKTITENKMEDPKSLLGLEFTLADEDSVGSFIVYTIDSVREDFKGRPIIGMSWVHNGKTHSTTYNLQSVLNHLERGIWKLYTGDVWKKLDD